MLLECCLFNFVHMLVDFWKTKNICMLEHSVLATRNNIMCSCRSCRHFHCSHYNFLKFC